MTEPRPHEHLTTVSRDMPCPVCGDGWHSPFKCNDPEGDFDATRDPCPCRFVPIPGAL